RAADRGLARSGFTDDAKGLAASDIETDTIHRLHGGAAIGGLKPYLEIAHRDDGVIGGLRHHGVPTIAAIGADAACCSAPGRSSSRKRQQRTLRPLPASSKTCSASQPATACGQRALKRQPLGISMIEGTRPGID